MKRKPRIYYSEAQKALMWDRWKEGELLSQSRVQIKYELMVNSSQLGFNPALLSADYKSEMGAKLFH